MALPTITNKQQEILKFIYHFRFLNRIQIQNLLNHKDHKNVNIWLKDLSEKEYINRIYSTKIGENTKPAIYYIGKNGIKLIKTLTNCPKEQLTKFYREKDRSEQFIEKYQLLTNIYIDLKNKNSDETIFKTTTNNVFSNPDSPYHFMAKSAFDLIIEKESKTNHTKKYCLLEIFDLTLRPYSVKKIIKDYFGLYFSNTWEENTHQDFPMILLVCPTTSTLIHIKRFIKKLLGEFEDIDIEIQLTTEKEIKEFGLTGEIWEEIR